MTNTPNRSNDLQSTPGIYAGVELVDIDTTIFNHIKDSIIPQLYQNGNEIKVPLIYGNAERWNDSRINGYIRDERGTIQVPVIMFKRESVEKNEAIPYFKDMTTMPSIALYSNTNRYEKFNVQNSITPMYEIYNISVPDYVTIRYDIIAWTNFTEHMNKLMEQFQFASGRYWGADTGYKFFTKLDNFDTAQEVSDGEIRLIKTEFQISVNGYLLPEQRQHRSTANKEISRKKIITTSEIQSGKSGFIYNNQDSTERIYKTKNILATYVNSNTVVINDITGIPVNPKYKMIINNIPKPISDLTYTYDAANNKLFFTISNSVIASTDIVFINGTFF